MPVVDSSVVVEVLADGENVEAADARLHGGEPLWVPHLIDAEVGHALRRGVRMGELEVEAAEEALWELDELPLRRISHEMLVHHAWELRDNVSFYDGLYVALAELFDEPLITLDARLARAGVEAEVELLAGAVEPTTDPEPPPQAA